MRREIAARAGLSQKAASEMCRVSPGKLTELPAQARHLIGACYDLDDA